MNHTKHSNHSNQVNEPNDLAAMAFYVAIDGDDHNPGTLERPFATLEAARDAVRAQKQKQGLPAGGVEIYLREGRYQRSASFLLSEADSGEAGAAIVYKPYPGEKVSLVGGYSLDAGAFEEVTDEEVRKRLSAAARDKIRQIDLKKQGVQSFGEIQSTGAGALTGSGAQCPSPELFVNGEVMRLARYPSEGYLTIGDIVDPGSKPRFYEADVLPHDPNYVPPEQRENPPRPFALRFEDERMANWRLEDVWMFGYWYFDWADGTLKVADLDHQEGVIRSSQASYYGVRTGQRFYLFNLLEELDSPGEFYLDRTSGMLYLYPIEELHEARVTLSMLKEPLALLNQASHVTLEGLIFEETRGYGVQVIGGSDNRIAGCTFRNIGLKAVLLGTVGEGEGEDFFWGYGDAGLRHVISGCVIHDTGHGGICMNGGNRKTLAPAGHVAEANHIYRYSRIKKTYCEAIQIFGVGSRASHNVIHDAPHAAIEFRGNNHEISYNEIYDVLQESDDAGAIYSGRDWTYRGNVIRSNYLHHLKGIGGEVGVSGVYLDDAMSSVEATGNVFYKVNEAFHIGGGRDHRIESNQMICCPSSIRYDDRAATYDWFLPHMDREKGTMFIRLREAPVENEAWRASYPELVKLADDEAGIPKGSIIRNNLLRDSGELKLAADVVKYGEVSNNISLSTLSAQPSDK
ncbi:right-handed parallel beta-helix repeat-containing protein [Paenibacillaceae bacterium]|nr:right-handed parallel beta-helix repeat-containing protein [Paenibacillaceae bacterium]